MDGTFFFRVHTRETDPERYPDGLARSIHFSVRQEGEEWKLLNLGYGILFATGLIDEKDRIAPRCIADPAVLRQADGTWLIFGERCMENGAPEENGGLVQAWRTADFCDFEPLGMISRPEGADAASDTAELPASVCEKVLARWQDPCGYPFRVDRAAPEGLPYPLVKDWGDPVFLYRDGKYYFIATSDGRNDIGLYVRSGDSLAALFVPDAVEHPILELDEEKEFIQTFWAPEFHEIGGELYILFAVSPHKWGPRCHIMKLKPGGEITDPGSWTVPVPVKRPDGSPLTDEEGITLDMTCFYAAGRLYAVWSYRRHIGTPLDTGSMLYIARMDEKDPSRLLSEPVLLSRPLYGWENVAGTINNEGPYPLLRSGKVYLAYSGGSANAFTYVIGLLTADENADLTDPSVWRKTDTPFMNFTTVPGDFGPGHNSFFADEKGDWWIAYHTVRSYEGRLRCPVMHRLYFPE